MSELQKGDKVQIKYWHELPKIPDVDWNPTFFEKHSGKRAEVTSNKFDNNISTMEKIEVRIENENVRTVDVDALRKLNIIPEELFKI